MGQTTEWRERPLAGGIQIAVSGFLGVNQAAGTLGCFVRKKNGGISADNPVYILTAAHVLKPALKDPNLTIPIDKAVHQPRAAGWDNLVGTSITENLIWSSTIDAGLVKVDPSIGWRNYIWKIGQVKGVRAPVMGELVMKHGAATGRTYGTVVNTNYHLAGNGGPSEDLIQINFRPDSEIGDPTEPKEKQNDSDRFALEGDSGAVVVGQDQMMVGLIHASENGDGVACKMVNVMEGLGVALAV